MQREADWAGTSLKHHPQLEKGPEIPDDSKIEEEQEQVDRDEEEKKKRKKEGRMCSEEAPSARETLRTGQLTVIHRYRPSTNDNTPAAIVCVWNMALQANGLVLCRQKTPVRYVQIHTDRLTVECLRHRHVFVFLIGCSYRGSGWALTSPTWLPPLATGGERGNSVR